VTEFLPSSVARPQSGIFCLRQGCGKPGRLCWSFVSPHSPVKKNSAPPSILFATAKKRAQVICDVPDNAHENQYFPL
jgi:hypothetical protein